jgi:hypothetical protein
MVVHIAPTDHLEPLIVPRAPDYPLVPRAEGFKLSRSEWAFDLTPNGRYHAAICQRMLAIYALGFENRAALSQRYGYSARHVQSVLSGQTYQWLTRPVRARLEAHGLVAGRMDRRIRTETVRRALERLAVLAADMLRDWSMYTNDQRQEVATDLWLISGAWRDQEELHNGY